MESWRRRVKLLAEAAGQETERTVVLLAVSEFRRCSQIFKRNSAYESLSTSSNPNWSGFQISYSERL